MAKRSRLKHSHADAPKQNSRHVEAVPHDPETEPDWEHECELCGARPIVPITGMCGPCTFGESDTIGGNW